VAKAKARDIDMSRRDVDENEILLLLNKIKDIVNKSKIIWIIGISLRNLSSKI
jgi:hypothetical protein